jgi:hypothetical protein
VARTKFDRFLSYYSRSKASVLLILLIAETGLLISLARAKTPLSRTALQVEAGKNYSLLVDAERFPMRVSAGDEINILVYPGQDTGFRLPANRVIIPQQPGQNAMAAVHQSRFKFYYNRPEEMKELYKGEHLKNLRGKTDWQTIENVLMRVSSELKSGAPTVYPPEDARDVLDLFRNKKEEIFCAQYCYVTVQFLQSLGYFARYITIKGHEICEVWVPQYHKWVCLDPTNDAYFSDDAGNKLSALEIARSPQAARAISPRKDVSALRLTDAYDRLWFWLTNNLATQPVNIYDLNKYRVRAIWRKDQLRDVEPGDLYTLYPDELYPIPSY